MSVSQVIFTSKAGISGFCVLAWLGLFLVYVGFKARLGKACSKVEVTIATVIGIIVFLAARTFAGRS